MTRPETVHMGATGSAARQASLREHNLGLVLRHVAGAVRPPSRAGLATITGLTRATVSALVDDLITGRLLTEVGPAPRSGAGRPALGLILDNHGPAGLGLEINVDYLAACVLDLTGAVRHRAVQRHDLRPLDPHAALAHLAGLAAAARADAEAQGLHLAGAGVAVPGLVTDGVVRLAPNLGWRDVDVATALGSHVSIVPAGLGVAIGNRPAPGRRGSGAAGASTAAGLAPMVAEPALVVDNEANLAAIGELHTAPATTDFLYVSGEVGVGAGIVLNGALFRGARGWSGELGHVPVQPNGPPCRCGARGCLERYAGQEAILTAAGLADQGRSPDEAVARLADLAAQGDVSAVRALTGAATALGVAVAGVVNLLDVDTVVLGGIYAPLAPWLCPTVEAEINHRVLTADWSPVTVRPSLLGADAAVIGAAGSVVRAILQQPSRWLNSLDR